MPTAAAIALLPIIGCNQKSIGKILYVTLELDNPFYTDMISGVKNQINAVPGWEPIIRAGKTATDVSGQINILEAYLGQATGSIKGVILIPAQSGPELTDVIRKYNTARIPVINVDIPIDDQSLKIGNATVSAYIGSNNVAGGQLAAEMMAEKLIDGGDILILKGAEGSANARNRLKGFVNRIDEIAAGKNVAFTKYFWNCEWSASEASSATLSQLSRGIPLRGIFAANDTMALGAAQAIVGYNLGNKPKPVIIGYDATPSARRAIAEGAMYGSISQNPYLMGKRAVEMIKDSIDGKPITSEIIPVVPVRASA